MKHRKKYVIFLACSFVVLILFLSFFRSIYTCFGYYRINKTEAKNSGYSLYIDYMGTQMRLWCNNASYDLVQANEDGWFSIEFKYSTYFPHVGYVRQIHFDEQLTKSWG